MHYKYLTSSLCYQHVARSSREQLLNIERNVTIRILTCDMSHDSIGVQRGDHYVKLDY